MDPLRRQPYLSQHWANVITFADRRHLTSAEPLDHHPLTRPAVSPRLLEALVLLRGLRLGKGLSRSKGFWQLMGHL